MSKNISNLSVRIGLKNNLFEKISERSLKSNNADGIKEIAKEYNMGVSTIHGAESFYEFLRPSHRQKKAFVCNGSACMCAGTQEPLKKKLQESVDQSLYYLNVPGNGTNLPFIEDPHVRLQQWGANLRTNTVELDSDLKGLTRRLNRDCKQLNDYKSPRVWSRAKIYPDNKQPITQQPRTTNPAWTARDLEQNHRQILLEDPQRNFEIPFRNNLNTQLLEKDYFLPKLPKVVN